MYFRMLGENQDLDHGMLDVRQYKEGVDDKYFDHIISWSSLRVSPSFDTRLKMLAYTIVIFIVLYVIGDISKRDKERNVQFCQPNPTQNLSLKF